MFNKLIMLIWFVCLEDDKLISISAYVKLYIYIYNLL